MVGKSFGIGLNKMQPNRLCGTFASKRNVKSKNGKVPIEIIDTEKELQRIVEHIGSCTEISIDTEFDDFNNQYGLHLQLIQLFDGATCFLIDTIKIETLDILWSVFENEHICKVLYSGANDVGVLKKFGCNLKNIFDNQVAATLCNRTENSYAALLKAEFGIEIDKSQQRSRWDNRPLTASQLLYASNDVIYLPRLKEIFLPEISKKKMLSILQEENILLESSIKKDYEPRLKPTQNRIFSHYARETLMEFKSLIDRYAKQLNLPPYYIVQDSLLEELVKDKRDFLVNPFGQGFNKEVLNNAPFKKQFLDIVHSIDTDKSWQKPIKEKIRQDDNKINQHDIRSNNKSFLPFKQYIIARYGEAAGAAVLKGLSKKISNEAIDWEDTRQYQRDLYNDFLAGS